MSEERPNHHDADLSLKVFELRRDPAIREAREAIDVKFWPKTLEEAQGILKSDHPLHSAWQQASGYWELVYGMARHGIVHAEYWAETHGEGLLLFAKLQRFLPKLREANPLLLRNSEWLTDHSETGKRLSAQFESRVKNVLSWR